MRPYPYRARGQAQRWSPGGQSGSVGSPGFSYSVPLPHLIEAGTPDARYAILELASGSWRVTFRHVPYDNRAMAELARRNCDTESASALATGWVR